jgi:hypothetical protein
MSFLNNLVSIGKSAAGFLGGNDIGSVLTRTALLGLAVNKLNSSINKGNDAGVNNQGTRQQLNPDTEHSIPVVYGTAFVEGIVTDAVLANNNKTMWYCITLCERTGVMLDGTQSAIFFEEVYYDGLRVDFASDGVTVDRMYAEDGDIINNYNGKIRFYPFSGDSTTPAAFTTESDGNTFNAYNIFPGWDSTKTMSDLVFCLVRVDYDARNSLTGLGELRFKLSNTLKKPGDVLFDYMTNARYGAGIPAEEINQ